MEQDTAGLGRIIRVLDEEYTQLQAAGLYREADRVFKRKQTYVDMRNEANDRQRSVFGTAKQN
jgi:hypothetical protein